MINRPETYENDAPNRSIVTRPAQPCAIHIWTSKCRFCIHGLLGTKFQRFWACHPFCYLFHHFSLLFFLLHLPFTTKCLITESVCDQEKEEHAYELKTEVLKFFSGAVSISMANFFYYRKRGSASYIVREVHSVRERETKWRHRCRAKISDEFTLSFCQKFAHLAMSLHFPLPKTRTFVSPFTLPVSPFTERSPLWRWNSQWVHALSCQKAARRMIENPRQAIKSCPVLYCSSHRKNESN